MNKKTIIWTLKNGTTITTNGVVNADDVLHKMTSGFLSYEYADGIAMINLEEVAAVRTAGPARPVSQEIPQ